MLARAGTSLAAAVGGAVALVRVGRHVDIDWVVARVVCGRKFRGDCWDGERARAPFIPRQRASASQYPSEMSQQYTESTQLIGALQRRY